MIIQWTHTLKQKCLCVCVLSLVTMSTPSLLELDPQKVVVEIRPPGPMDELKNELMMSVLLRLEWFASYRTELGRFREHGGARPTYPTERVDKIEKMVDRLIMQCSSV